MTELTVVPAETEPDAAGLWPNDPGSLPFDARRVFVQLLRGPYISAERQPNLWSTLVANQASIRARLADCLLELVLDDEAEVAFTRNLAVEGWEIPQVTRTVSLTFIQTAMLLLLRRLLLRAERGERVFIGLDEAIDQLDVYRASQKVDRSTFAKRVRAAWVKFQDLSILRSPNTEDRCEISPVLRLIFGSDEISELMQEYRRVAVGETTVADDETEAVPQ